MKKLALASIAIASLLIAGCSSNIDKEVTLIKGSSTMQDVENILGSPDEVKQNGNKVTYDYTSSHVGRDIATGLLLGWQFLDNHVLTL